MRSKAAITAGDTHRVEAEEVIAPDGLRVRPLGRVGGASTALFTLGAGLTGRAVKHRSVSEIWYVTSGRGRLWRRTGDVDVEVPLAPGQSVTIAPDTCFQVRAELDATLEVLGVTTPPWPGEGEARLVAGAWPASFVAALPQKAELRAPLPGEGPALGELALRSKAFWGYSEDFLEACRAELAVEVPSPDPMVVLAAGEMLLGFACVSKRDGACSELEHLFLAPRYIGAGFGVQLLDAAARMSAELGARRMLIQADPQAAGFYTRAGALAVGQRPSGSVPGRMLPLFELATPAPGETQAGPRSGDS